MYEVDFFAVGEGERSGDAIALRYTIPGRAEPIVGVIDAGFLSNGNELVEHIPKYYGTDRVDFVLSTHPDGDHINVDSLGRTSDWPRLIVLPHHGSRHNLDLAMIQRILGGHSDQTYGFAVASVSEESDNPSPRVANAVGQRGYRVYATAGAGFRVLWNAPARPGWENPIAPLGPLDESDDHDD